MRTLHPICFIYLEKCFSIQIYLLILKNGAAGLKISAQRGLCAVFSELARKSQMPQLMKQDENGLSLIHHAAIHNRPQVQRFQFIWNMPYTTDHRYRGFSLYGIMKIQKLLVFLPITLKAEVIPKSLHLTSHKIIVRCYSQNH